MKQRAGHGILAGGNWIIDRVKVIDVYPSQERLANILSESKSHGGAPFNVLKALNRMAFDFPLDGIGVIGDDENGQEILRQCSKRNIIARQHNTSGFPGYNFHYFMRKGVRLFFSQLCTWTPE